MTRIALTGLTNAIPLPVYCDSVNMLARLRGRSYRLRPFGEVGIHVAEDGTGADAGRIHICRRGRHWRYKRGVMRGVDVVARQYGLHTLDIRPGGVFVDCGANVGELGLWARQRGLAYVAFEPEELEARCCDLNNFEGRPETRRKALWHEAAVLQFHSKPDTADSSVFEIDAAAPPRDVEAVRLDTVHRPGGVRPGHAHLQAGGRGRRARGPGRCNGRPAAFRLCRGRLRLRARARRGAYLRRGA
jgi:FkbM family methyltransferase